MIYQPTPGGIIINQTTTYTEEFINLLVYSQGEMVPYMNSVYVYDQFLNSYNFQHWMRNHKWWFVLFVWGFVIMILNTYIFYNTDHLILLCKEKGEVLSWYEFRK